jgi:hypothetical protein
VFHFSSDKFANNKSHLGLACDRCSLLILHSTSLVKLFIRASTFNFIVLKCLQELAFQKLVFVTMLAWEDPYKEDDSPLSSLDNYSVLVMTYSSIFSLCWSK